MTNARLHDLVRHQRSDLHEAGLITDDEFVALAGDHAAVARLEGYDAMRARIADYRRDNDALDKENDALRTRAESAERRVAELEATLRQYEPAPPVGPPKASGDRVVPEYVDALPNGAIVAWNYGGRTWSSERVAGEWPWRLREDAGDDDPKMTHHNMRQIARDYGATVIYFPTHTTETR